MIPKRWIPGAQLELPDDFLNLKNKDVTMKVDSILVKDYEYLSGQSKAAFQETTCT